jgi:TetR/AcrR family transcriptional regulator, tetracycline repressor protein
VTVIPEPAPPGRRPRLDRDRVVRAAVVFVDGHGTQGLTMRRLGAALGVEAMALYRYVSGREDLLEAVVTHLLDGLHERLDQELTQTWQGYLQALGHEVRRVCVDHPNAFPLIATRHPAAPWLRPPLRDVALVERFLATLRDFGMDDAQVVAVYRAYTGFLLGSLLLEAVVRGARTAPAEEPLDEGDADLPEGDGRADLDDAPTIRRLRPLLGEDRSEEEFEAGMEALLDRLELSLSQ